MSLPRIALSILVLSCTLFGQNQKTGPKPITMTVEVLASDMRLSGARVHLSPADNRLLLLGPAHNKVEGSEFKGFEFPSFLQSASLEKPGGFTSPAAEEGAVAPMGRSYGNLVHDSERERLHYFGGFSPSLLAEHWVLDLQTMKWSLLEEGKGPGPRDAAASFLSADRASFFLFGGLKSKGPMAELWCHNFETKVWSLLEQKDEASWPAPRLTAPGANLADGRGVVIGGLDARFGALADVWAFDSKTMTWSALADLPEALSGTAAIWHPKLKRLLVIGGSRAAAAQTSVYAYDPTTNTWQKLGDLKGAIAHASAVYDPKCNRVFVIGGTVGMFLAPHPEAMIQSLTFK